MTQVCSAQFNTDSTSNVEARDSTLITHDASKLRRMSVLRGLEADWVLLE